MDPDSEEIETSGVEDELVREIDVYFASSVDPQTRLYMFQYSRPYDFDRCEEVRMNPETAQVEIDLSIDKDSKNCDSGSDLGVQMEKQTLHTSCKPTPTSGLALGVLSENKLHLNPIRAVLQLSSSLHHPDSNSKKQIKIAEQTKDMGAEFVTLKYHNVKSDMAAGLLHKVIAQKFTSP